MIAFTKIRLHFRLNDSISPTSCLLASATIPLGLNVMLGWVLDIPLLKSVIPGAVEMKVNTRLGLILSGVALFLLAYRDSILLNRTAHGLAVCVFFLGLATLGQYGFGWNLGIDELLFLDLADAHNSIPGRMSPFSAIIFTALGIAIFTLPYQRLVPVVRIMMTPVVGLSVLTIIGYIWGASELITEHWIPPMAINTASSHLAE